MTNKQVRSGLLKVTPQGELHFECDDCWYDFALDRKESLELATSIQTDLPAKKVENDE